MLSLFTRDEWLSVQYSIKLTSCRYTYLYFENIYTMYLYNHTYKYLKQTRETYLCCKEGKCIFFYYSKTFIYKFSNMCSIAFNLLKLIVLGIRKRNCNLKVSIIKWSFNWIKFFFSFIFYWNFSTKFIIILLLNEKNFKLDNLFANNSFYF